jgi:hypothetical protein
MGVNGKILNARLMFAAVIVFCASKQFIAKFPNTEQYKID